MVHKPIAMSAIAPIAVAAIVIIGILATLPSHSQVFADKSSKSYKGHQGYNKIKYTRHGNIRTNVARESNTGNAAQESNTGNAAQESNTGNAAQESNTGNAALQSSTGQSNVPVRPATTTIKSNSGSPIFDSGSILS